MMGGSNTCLGMAKGLLKGMEEGVESLQKSQTLLGEKSVLDISKNALDKKVGDAVDMA